MRLLILVIIAASGLSGCATNAYSADPATLQEEVMAAERAFARTMADRDQAAFVRYLGPEAVFFNGEEAIRGSEAVAAAWRPLFEGPQAPFSWDPDQVQVLESGNLALSTGLVYDPAGNVTGRFNSIWRLESPGIWRVVFDKGSPVCNCPPR